MTVSDMLRDYRRDGVRLAAALLLKEPERVANQRLGTFLSQIISLPDEALEHWTDGGRIGMRRISSLSRDERIVVVNRIAQYAREHR